MDPVAEAEKAVTIAELQPLLELCAAGKHYELRAAVDDMKDPDVRRLFRCAVTILTSVLMDSDQEDA